MYRYLLLLLCVFLLSCDSENALDLLKTVGKTTEQTRNTTVCHTIVAKDNTKVFISQGTRPMIIVKAGKNIMADIKTTVKDSVLTITNNVGYSLAQNNNEQIEVYVQMPFYKRIEAYQLASITTKDTLYGSKSITKEAAFQVFNSGGGDINVTFKGNYLLAANIKNGNITFQGKAGVFEIYTIGTGYTYARNFQTTYCYLEQRSAGDISVWVDYDFGARMYNTGNVLYYTTNKSLQENLKRYGPGKYIITN